LTVPSLHPTAMFSSVWSKVIENISWFVWITLFSFKGLDLFRFCTLIFGC